MALKKAKQLPIGVTGEYWRIIQLNTNFDRLDGVIDLALYLSQAAREAGAAPMGSFSHQLGADFVDALYNGADKVKNINLQKAYVELKKQAQAEKLKDPADPTYTPDLAWFADAADA